jgi:heme-degrading monooxygenase HmoA
MPTLQIEHGVRDFDAWKQAFDSDPVGREAGGVRSYRVLRPTEDPQRVIIHLDFDTTAEAEAFHEKLRGLWAGAGASLGLENPHARVVEVVESVAY